MEKAIISTELTVLLERIKKAAPPPPTDTLYRWLTKVYRLRRTLSAADRKALRTSAKKMGITTGDKPLRAVIAKTAGAHVGAKMKWKYAAALETALNEKVKAKNLRQFIDGHGGINRCASGGTPPSMGSKLKRAKPPGLKPLKI